MAYKITCNKAIYVFPGDDEIQAMQYAFKLWKKHRKVSNEGKITIKHIPTWIIDEVGLTYLIRLTREKKSYEIMVKARTAKRAMHSVIDGNPVAVKYEFIAQESYK